jgi:hypothetical protein
MPTECSPALFDFAPVETRRVVAAFDGGAITSNAGALLLGATDRAIGLVRRFAACFRDTRAPERIEHEAATLVGQRVFGIALGHEDLVDHDQLRHDPMLAILAGKPEARRVRPSRGIAHVLHPTALTMSSCSVSDLDGQSSHDARPRQRFASSAPLRPSG